MAPCFGSVREWTDLISVTVSTAHKLQTMGNAVRRIFGVMGDKQQLSGTFANQNIHEAPYQLTVKRIQSLQGLVKNQQRRMLHQRPDDQRQPLLSPGETVERRIGGTFVDSQYIQPVLHQLALLIRNG